jgi:CheY-like chemotaxis protein
VEIAVSDRGHGIPAEILPRVFDPFFTTRPSGTGLGLATSYSIVRRHGGHVTIDSTPGVGTTVTVLLPAAEAPVPAVDPVAAPAPAPAPTRPLHVLAMDDEPLVLKVAVKQMRRLGFEVETAADGAEAVEAFRRAREAGRPFDLVLLDLTVPGGMGGAQAVQRMQEIDPGVRAVACSGYFDAAVMAEPGRFGFAGVLAKPYLAADLERVLHAVRAGVE